MLHLHSVSIHLRLHSADVCIQWILSTIRVSSSGMKEEVLLLIARPRQDNQRYKPRLEPVGLQGRVRLVNFNISPFVGNNRESGGGRVGVRVSQFLICHDIRWK